MRLLLDHCVDQRLRHHFPGHDVATAREMGWAALSNGALLAAAENAGFDAFVTVDRSIRHQQNLTRLPIAVLELRAVSNDVVELRRLTPHFDAALERTRSFLYVTLTRDGTTETLAPRAGG